MTWYADIYGPENISMEYSGETPEEAARDFFAEAEGESVCRVFRLRPLTEYVIDSISAVAFIERLEEGLTSRCCFDDMEIPYYSARLQIFKKRLREATREYLAGYDGWGVEDSRIVRREDVAK